MEKEKKTTSIPHKYNVGDEITVKIAKVESVGSKPAYRIKGIENIKISETAIEKMSQKKIKPGDTIYAVLKADWDQIIYFDAYEVEDIGFKEVKVSGDWTPIDDDIFFNEADAEKKAIELAKKYGLQIVKDGLFNREGKSDRE